MDTLATRLLSLARAKIDDGKERLSLDDAPFRFAWFPVPADPISADIDEFKASFHVRELDDGEDEDEITELQEEWHQELEALRSTLKELSPSATDGDYPVERFDQSVERAALAMQIWDRHGIPYRVRNGRVFHLKSPTDLMGQVIIKSVDLPLFFREVARQTALDAIALRESKRTADRWRAIGICASIAFLLALIQVFG
jgi:hypothetical protein